MFCPKCKSEYREGYIRCPDCALNLVPMLDNESCSDTSYVKKEAPPVDPVIIRFVSNEIDAEMTMDLLRQSNIPCFRKYREAGEYLKIVGGFSVFGQDIYVDRKDYDAASDLLNDWDKNQEPADGDVDEYEDASNDNISFLKNHSVIARIIIYFSLAELIIYLIYRITST